MTDRDDGLRSELVKRCRRGEGLRRLSETTGLSYYGVRERLREEGVRLRNPGRPKDRE